MNFEARGGGCGTNEVDHDFIRLQRLALPVAGDVTEQAVFDLIPFAGARRKMADLDLEPGFVTQLLQFDLPQATAAAVAATAVSGDQQAPCLAMTMPAQTFPPASNRGDSKLGRVAADADADPGLVVPQVIDAIRNGLALARIGKVVRIDFARLALATPGLPRILEISQGFLLLGVHRNGGLAAPLLRFHAAVDVAKLRIPIRMRLAFARLAVGLQTVAGLLQQMPYRRRSNGIALSAQFLCQPSRALAGPAQRRHRIASTVRFDQALQCRFESGTYHLGLLAPRARPPLPSVGRRVSAAQLSHAASDCRMRQTGCRTHHGNAASTQSHCFHSGPPSPRTLREFIRKSLELALNP